MLKFYKKNQVSTSDRLSRDGFTLVETLVAISIFTVAVMALVNMTTTGVSNANYAKKKMIATSLAQEGIEYIRNMRDTFVLHPDPDDTRFLLYYGPESTVQDAWNDFNVYLTMGSSGCNTSDGCTSDAPSLFSYSPANNPMRYIKIEKCVGTCSPILWDPTDRGYQYDTGVDSGFVRKIQTESINANETRVTSTVTWKQGIVPHSVTLSEDLFNWVE